MPSQLKIYIDRLKEGRVEKIDEEISSDILEVDEKDLSFTGTIKILGQAYLADDHLIINCKISCMSRLPCSICNSSVENPIELDNFYFTIPLNELTSAIFDFSTDLREAVLLQTPAYVECSGGKCPDREQIKCFLKKPDSKENSTSEPQVYFPFADLHRAP